MTYNHEFAQLITNAVFNDNLTFFIKKEYGYYTNFNSHRSIGTVGYKKKKIYLFEDLASLAHEMGHHQSKLDGNWEEFDFVKIYETFSLNRNSLSELQRLLIVLEEYRAWCLGWVILWNEFKDFGKKEHQKYWQCAYKYWKTYPRVLFKVI